MNPSERPPEAAAAMTAILRAAWRARRSPLAGSHLDREERDAQELVRMLHVVEALRQNTSIP